MITFEEAYHIVMSCDVQSSITQVSLAESVGYILAEDVLADMDMPPFNKSAVDGFACRRSDSFEKLEVIEVLPAGTQPSKPVRKGECTQIMTGAMVPPGADTVVMIEQTEWKGERHIRFIGETTLNNICYQAEDIAKNSVVLEKGTLIRPQEIAVLATFGYAMPKVYRKPKIGIVITGDELVEPHIKPDNSQIRNSNGPQILTQALLTNAEAKHIGIAKDTKASLHEMISDALENSDMVILTGGVSMGEYDFVPKILEELNVELKFRSIAVQPGRPTLFGVKGEKFIFGLPGNPVSSFIQFELLVKPLIYKIMGHKYQPVILQLPMGETFTRKKTTRKTVIPVSIKDSKIYPVEYHGSAHINALTMAQGFVWLEIGETTLSKGELIDVRQF